MATVTSSGGFKPSTTDTPLDVRTRVNTYVEIKDIQNPYIGMEITVLEDETNNGKKTKYEVVDLLPNEKEIPNALINIDTLKRKIDIYEDNGNLIVGDSDDESNSKKLQTKHDDSLLTNNKEIPKAINELKLAIDNVEGGSSGGNSVCYIKRITIEEGNPTNINTLCASINSAIGTDYQVGDILTGYANLITLNYGDTSKTDSGTLVVYIEDNGHSIVYLYSQNDGSVYSGSLSGLAMGVNLVKIGEIDLSSYQTTTDNALTTTDKTVIGAINELKLAIDNVEGGSSGGSGLTTTQSQQLQTAYQHSQSPHITTSDVNTAVQTYADNAVSTALDGHTFKFLTQAEYDALETKDPLVEYHITDLTESETFVTKNELETTIGNINTILDNINGEVI